MTKLFDLTVTRFDLFLRTEGREPKASETSCWQSFYPALKAAAEWSKCKELPQNSLPASSQILKRDFDATNRRVVAESWLDVYCLETAIFQPGESSADKFPTLDFAPAPDARHLGAATCYWAEFDDPLTIESVNFIVNKIIPQSNFRVVALRLGFLALPDQDAPEQKFVMLVNRQDATAMREANVVLRHSLPRLVATQLKGKRVFNEYQQHSPTHQNFETALVQQSELYSGQKMSLRGLEKATLGLSAQILPLTKSIGDDEERRHTLSINARNADTIIKSPPFDLARVVLQAYWVDPLQLQADQIAADATYRRQTVEYNQQQLELYEKRASLISSKWQRRLSILFGAFVLLSVPQYFPEITNPQWSPYFAWRWRLLYLVGGGLLMWSFIWWLGKHDKR